MLDHCFVVPAYGESPHLEECLRSLAAQTVPAQIVVATSTPSSHISELALKYSATLRVNPHRGGIGSDWNFALDAAPTRWVTIAHQDDVYLPDFLARTTRAIVQNPDATLAFSDYSEILPDRIRTHSSLLLIKRSLLELGFLGRSRSASTFLKMNALRFGCAICCPAATIDKSTTRMRFRTDLRVDLDWAAWLELAKQPGAFVYVRERLMRHRVHDGSETSGAIANGHRVTEDAGILQGLWPRPIAKAIAATYGIAYGSNESGNAP